MEITHTPPSATIDSIYRYPVKGLTPEPLPRAVLAPGQTLLADRRYAIENMVGAPVHPLRFRANVYVEGWPAWSEFDLVDRTLAIGATRLKVVKRIVRCAAVNVDPDTAQRDLAIPQALQRRLGHGDCGIYAEVITGGTISDGEVIAAEQPELL